MEPNPFQPPLADCSFPLAPQSQSLPQVDGKYLVVGTETVLPAICVRTNEPLSEKDLVRRQLEWTPPWIRWGACCVFLITGLAHWLRPELAPFLWWISYGAVLLVSLLGSKKCTLTYGLHPWIRREARRWTAIQFLLVGAGVGLVFLASYQQISILKVITTPAVILVVWLTLMLTYRPVSLKRYRDGKFWIEGCCPQFLATIEKR